MSIEQERTRLEQMEKMEELNKPFRVTDMVTVYLSDVTSEHNRGIYCALVPTTNVQDSLNDPSWDLSLGDGHPGTVKSYDGDKWTVEYFRFGGLSSAEPLIFYRSYSDLKPTHCELSEEFRLFHNLYFDQSSNEYIKFDNSGRETSIAVMRKDHITVRLKEIRQFIAAKDMHFVILFDYKEFSDLSLTKLNLSQDSFNQRGELDCWTIYNGGNIPGSSKETFSCLLGKRFIQPLPKEKSGLYGFTEEESKRYADFIIEINEDGEEVTHSCNPDLLANYFGANPESPNYLTAVSFHREVLNKYFGSSKYWVSDSVVGCGNLWSMYIDNHDNDRVSAWLGDLGKDLPYDEQLHWRSHNIASSKGVSEVYFRRQMLGEFADSTQLEYSFQSKYRDLSKACDQFLGWQVFLPLSQSDAYRIHDIRIPASDEQKELDELILALATIMVDSLNVRKLKTLILVPNQESNHVGSISLLKSILMDRNFENTEQHISFLHKIQELRSTGSAHRKGSKYQKALSKVDGDSKNVRNLVEEFLDQSCDFLDFLVKAVCSGKFGSINIDPE